MVVRIPPFPPDVYVRIRFMCVRNGCQSCVVLWKCSCRCTRHGTILRSRRTNFIACHFACVPHAPNMRLFSEHGGSAHWHPSSVSAQRHRLAPERPWHVFTWNGHLNCTHTHTHNNAKLRCHVLRVQCTRWCRCRCALTHAHFATRGAKCATTRHANLSHTTRITLVYECLHVVISNQHQ